MRLYEAQGFVQAERTPAGWRVYGPDQIARLHQILALKSFGFPLSRIGELLAGGLSDLATFLELHEQMLLLEAKRLDPALQLLSAARAKLASQGGLSPDDLMDLSKDMMMTDTSNQDRAAAYEAIAAKHFAPGDRAVLEANGYQGIGDRNKDWDALHEEAAGLMKIGDPGSPEAMDLARRWMGKVFEVTGDDPALTVKVKKVARETLDQPAFAAHSASSIAMMDFVTRAYGAAIAAGIMPKPEGAPQ